MSAPTILLVEDNPITRKMLRFALETDGYEVAEAADGRTALELSAARRPDLLVLDYVVPDMDGLRLLAEVRRRTAAPELPAIVVTGMVSRLEELRAQGGMSTQFLAKPVEPSRLLEVVRAQLSAPDRTALGLRVLVVDDELLNRKLASFRLKLEGYEVETASGGAEGLDLARRRPPDAILADVLMPSMDGFAFCHEARRDPALAAIPIVLVSSAYVDVADQELARKMGANALVVRAPDLRDASAALAEALRRAAPPPTPLSDERVAVLHRERLQVQLERQTARNETLLRQAAIQATALSIIRGLSEVLAQPKDVTQILGDVLVHCLDAAGLSTGLLYVAEPRGRRLQAQFGIPADRKADAEAIFGHPELIRRIVEARQPVALSRGSPDADGETLDFLARLGHSSALILPFVVLGETFGELVLASDSHDLSDSAWIGFARSLALQFGQTVALGQSLKRLAASEGRYRALMEHANDAILILDPTAKVLEVNRQTERLLGRRREEIVGHYYDEFVDPDEQTDSARRQGELVTAGTLRVESRQMVRADGTRVSVEVSASVVRVNEESVVLTILRDVTERRRGEEAIRRSEVRMKSVLDAALDAVIMMDEQGRVVSWNARAEDLFGWPQDEAIGGRLSELIIPPRYRADHTRGLKAYLATGEGPVIGRRIELSALRRDGSEFPVELTVTALKEGGAFFFNAFVADITERKRAQEAVREAQQRLQHVVSSSPSVLYTLKVDGQMLVPTWVSENIERIVGYAPEDVTGSDWWNERLHPEDRESIGGQVATLLARGHVTREYRFRDRDGAFRWVRDEQILIQDASGAHEVVGSWSDITEKRSLESQLLQSQKMESMGRLAGGVAHDFNNLLGIITGYGELLRRRVAADPRLVKYVDDIVKAAERAAGLTRQLLAFGRKQVLQPRILDLNAVVGETEKMLRRLIGEDIQLMTVLDEHVGPVTADPGQMDQVLMNLAVNARDAMPRGGRLTIETGNVVLDQAYARQHAGVEPGHYVMLAVSDTGHGMTPEVRTRIFEPFFTTKDPGKGTGLGLATVHGIVQQSGGHVWVYSEPGQGATFKVYLPRRDAPGAPVEAPELAPVELPRGSETILLVEDEASLRELVRECLEASGYKVIEASHGTAALETGERHPGRIDLLMTDVVMPGMSGRELAERLRASRPELRTLYMSGYTDDAVVLHGVLAEDMAFLQKPFTAEQLARRVREVLDRPADK